jgi:hypothetical protein
MIGNRIGYKSGYNNSQTDVKNKVDDISQSYFDKMRYWNLDSEGYEALRDFHLNTNDLSDYLFHDTIPMNDVVYKQIDREKRNTKIYGQRVKVPYRE